MKLFDFTDLEVVKSDESVSAKQRQHDKHCQHIEKVVSVAVENLKDLAGRLPLPGEIYFLWSLKSFNAFSFIKYVILERDRVEELVISSYNIGKIIILSLMKLVDNGRIEKLHVTLSDVSKSRFPHNYDLMNLEASKRSNVEVAYLWNHSKVALMKSMDDYFIVEGSGNFSENSRHEQYVFLNNKDVYDFRRKWITTRING